MFYYKLYEFVIIYVGLCIKEVKKKIGVLLSWIWEGCVYNIYKLWV